MKFAILVPAIALDNAAEQNACYLLVRIPITVEAVAMFVKEKKCAMRVIVNVHLERP
jgi:hypothetical protein